MTDRVPGAPGRCKAVIAGEELQKLQAGEEFAITLRRDDQPVKEGTPYSKAVVLPDELAASLCPGVQDPAPKDAFAALHTQKADTVRRARGRNITLRNAAHTPLMGLKIHGQNRSDGCVGDNGSVVIKVRGKNLIDMSDWIKQGAATLAEDGSYHTDNMTMYNTYGRPEADKHLYIPENGNVPITWRITYKKDATDVNGACFGIAFVYTDGTKENYSVYGNIVNGVSEWATKSFSSNPNKTIKLVRYVWATYHCWVKEFQMEFGTTATEYEPYVEPQTLMVPTPNGLAGDDSVRDEIDFAKGVLIRRYGEQSEEKLPDQVLEAYTKLHTCAHTTVITNDAGADMEVTYYTPSTAVQMVHSPADKGKILSIDEHGCVVLAPNDNAPAGFGLGGSAAQVITSIAELDHLTKNGWYSFYCTGSQLCGVWFNYASVFVTNMSEDYGVWQEVRVVDTNIVFKRKMSMEGIWDEYWEIENPPMDFGVEYRTTERHNGKAVYVTLFNLGNLPDTGTLPVSISSGIDRIVYMQLTLKNSNGTGDVVNPDSVQIHFGHNGPGSTNNSTWADIITTADVSDYTAQLVVKYTKV